MLTWRGILLLEDHAAVAAAREVIGRAPRPGAAGGGAQHLAGGPCIQQVQRVSIG